MTESLVLSYVIDAWIAAMLTVQSVILYKLLPEIKKVSSNSAHFKSLTDKGIIGLLGGALKGRSGGNADGAK